MHTTYFSGGGDDDNGDHDPQTGDYDLGDDIGEMIGEHTQEDEDAF